VALKFALTRFSWARPVSRLRISSHARPSGSVKINYTECLSEHQRWDYLNASRRKFLIGVGIVHYGQPAPIQYSIESDHGSQSGYSQLDRDVWVQHHKQRLAQLQTGQRSVSPSRQQTPEDAGKAVWRHIRRRETDTPVKSYYLLNSLVETNMILSAFSGQFVGFGGGLSITDFTMARLLIPTIT